MNVFPSKKTMEEKNGVFYSASYVTNQFRSQIQITQLYYWWYLRQD